MTKCPKCENDTYKIENNDTISFVECKKCGCAVGVLENIDFRERFKTIIKNQQGIDRLINDRTDDIKREINKYEDKIDFILEVAEKLNRQF